MSYLQAAISPKLTQKLSNALSDGSLDGLRETSAGEVSRRSACRSQHLATDSSMLKLVSAATPRDLRQRRRVLALLPKRAHTTNE
jgi:hypothetical protein